MHSTLEAKDLPSTTWHKILSSWSTHVCHRSLLPLSHGGSTCSIFSLMRLVLLWFILRSLGRGVGIWRRSKASSTQTIQWKKVWGRRRLFLFLGLEKFRRFEPKCYNAMDQVISMVIWMIRQHASDIVSRKSIYFIPAQQVCYSMFWTPWEAIILSRNQNTGMGKDVWKKLIDVNFARCPKDNQEHSPGYRCTFSAANLSSMRPLHFVQ